MVLFFKPTIYIFCQVSNSLFCRFDSKPKSIKSYKWFYTNYINGFIFLGTSTWSTYVHIQLSPDRAKFWYDIANLFSSGTLWLGKQNKNHHITREWWHLLPLRSRLIILWCCNNLGEKPGDAEDHVGILSAPHLNVKNLKEGLLKKSLCTGQRDRIQIFRKNEWE